MSTFTFAGRLSVVECCVCHCNFGMPENMYRKFRENHELFSCPVGHKQLFIGQTEEQRLKDELTRTKQRLEQEQEWSLDRLRRLEQTSRRLTATRGVVTRHKNKIAKGTCPCCSHTFKDVREHMAREHPNWEPLKEVEAREADESKAPESGEMRSLKERIQASLTSTPKPSRQIKQELGSTTSTVDVYLSEFVKSGTAKRTPHGYVKP